MFRRANQGCVMAFSAVLFTFTAQLASGQSKQVGTGPDSIRVTVTGILSTNGQIRFELWNSPKGFPAHTEFAVGTMWVQANEAKGGQVTASFIGLAPGYYVVAVAHDQNGNGKIETDFVGFPTEPWAVSNHAESYFHPPRFDSAKFKVDEPKYAITLKLHNSF